MPRSRSGGRRRFTRAGRASRRRPGSRCARCVGHRSRARRRAPRSARRRRTARRAASRGVTVREEAGASAARFVRGAARVRGGRRSSRCRPEPSGSPPNGCPSSRPFIRAPRRTGRSSRCRRAAPRAPGPATRRSSSSSAAGSPWSDRRRRERSRHRWRLPARRDAALLALETEGAVLRGRFSGADELEWCDRRLLARIHRYTLNRLRAEIEPITRGRFPAIPVRVARRRSSRISWPASTACAAVVGILDGVELPASAWERAVLPARLDHYEPAMARHAVPHGRGGVGRD